MCKQVVGFLFLALIYSCEKVEEINVIHTSKGGSATVTVKNGFETWDPVFVNETLTAKNMGVYKRSESKYTLILEEVDNSGKLINQLLLDFSKYDFVCEVDSGQFVTLVNGLQLQVFDMPKDHSAQLIISQEGTTGQLISGTFWFPASGNSGQLCKVEGSFSAYLLPDTE